MFNPFICGSFHHQEDDDKDSLMSPSSTPKRSKTKRSGSYSKSKESKNPYANRGLDKFSALLAELEDKKQKIYTEKGAEDISMVQFAYSNDNTIKAIVVKAKEKKSTADDADQNVNENHETGKSAECLGNGVQESALEIEKKHKKKRSGFSDFFRPENFRKPSYYLPVVVILILLLLTMFGRSFVILCTSIGWYLIPTINGGSSSTTTTTRRPKRKKEVARRLSEKHTVNDGSSSPRSVITGPVDMSSPRRHGHGHNRSL